MIMWFRDANFSSCDDTILIARILYCNERVLNFLENETMNDIYTYVVIAPVDNFLFCILIFLIKFIQNIFT